MKKTKILILLLLLYNFVLSQNVKVINVLGKGQVQWYPERESLTEARKRALELAKIDALESAFGTVITQGNVIYIENKKTGEKVETNSTFKMIGNTAVKGEIIDILKEDYKKTTKRERVNRKRRKITYITCKLKIKAKEITESDIEMETYPLNSVKLLKPINDFKEGDNLFLYCRAPVNGYLLVFLDDGKQAQVLLPYRNMPDGMEDAMPIIADKEYVFFSDYEEHNYFDDDFFAEDTYKLIATDKRDLNELYVIFSKEKLNKPVLNDANAEMEIEADNYELPRIMNSEDLKKWLVKIKQIRSDVKVKTFQISIEK